MLHNLHSILPILLKCRFSPNYMNPFKMLNMLSLIGWSAFALRGTILGCFGQEIGI